MYNHQSMKKIVICRYQLLNLDRNLLTNDVDTMVQQTLKLDEDEHVLLF